MAFNWKGLASGIGSALGGIAGASGSAFGAIMNYKEIRAQRKWLEKMSNTAHQREVSDLRKAGLNPVLSAMGGSGATTPATGTADMSGLGEMTNSALAWRQQKNENKLADTNADLNSANAFKARRDASLAGEMARNEAEKFDLYKLQKEQVAQDIKNSIRLTDAQVKNYSASTYYQNEQARYHGAQNAWTRGAWLGEWLRDKKWQKRYD